MSDYPDIRSVSVDRNGDHDILLTMWGEDVEVVSRQTLPLRAALSLLRDLAITTTACVEDAAVSVVRGDCPTCLIRRLVDVEVRPGRTEQQHCPDCSRDLDTVDAGRSLARPRRGGGVR